MNRNELFVDKLTKAIGSLVIEIENYLEPTRVRKEIENKLNMLSGSGLLLFDEIETGETTVSFGLDVTDHLVGEGADKMTAFLDLSKKMIAKGEQYASKRSVLD